MTVCIQYSRPASGQGESEIFGLDVAVNNFLSAYFRHGTQNPYICRPTDIASYEHFKSLAEAAGVDAEKHCIGIDPRHPKSNLENISCIFRPDPLTVDLIWRRQQLLGKGFSTCGLVHTMSGERIAKAVADLCIAPSDTSDALICPSESIRDAVQNLWQLYAEYLNHHFGSTYRCPVQTPVIPLGIDANKFVSLTTGELRKAQRSALNIEQDEIVILFVGRLSFATKAHPLPLFMAAEQAAKRLKRKIRLVMYGYFKPKDMENHFKSLAKDIAKTVAIDFILNDDARFPKGLWAAADIFTSLSDNIQESFGLTPIEAMAAGLPSVITDWNGYRGGVRNGIDGFLIPTLTPPDKAGLAIAEAYYNEENYGISLVGASQSTALDIGLCADAFVALADDNMRRQFSESARARALDTYDWKHIITSYEALWEELAYKRQSMPRQQALPRNWQAMHPAFPNPWQMFSSFPSKKISYKDRIQVLLTKDEIYSLIKHDMNYFLPELLVEKESMIELVEAIRRAPAAPFVQDILGTFPDSEQDRLLRCIGWMLKHGVCKVES